MVTSLYWPKLGKSWNRCRQFSRARQPRNIIYSSPPISHLFLPYERQSLIVQEHTSNTLTNQSLGASVRRKDRNLLKSRVADVAGTEVDVVIAPPCDHRCGRLRVNECRVTLAPLPARVYTYEMFQCPGAGINISSLSIAPWSRIWRRGHPLFSSR